MAAEPGTDTPRQADDIDKAMSRDSQRAPSGGDTSMPGSVVEGDMPGLGSLSETKLAEASSWVMRPVAKAGAAPPFAPRVVVALAKSD